MNIGFSSMFTIKAVLKIVPQVAKHKNSTYLVKFCSNRLHQVSTAITQPQDSILCKGKTTQILIPSRQYAKGRDKKKEKGKAKVEINESQLAEVLNLESVKNQMQRSLEQLKDDYIKHLSVRSTTGSIEGIPVELDGKEHTLQELAQIIRKNPKTLVLNMSVFPQAIPAALKAIEKSGMNLNPQQDGTTLFIPIPKVTTEHRENLSKNAKTMFVKCKDSIRDVQNKQVKTLKRKDKLGQDLVRSCEQQIIAIADGFISQAEKILESKQSELVGNN